MLEPRDRLSALDGVRGVAALAVLAFHGGSYLEVPWMFGHGALAVDIFFVMSGVVVARAYGARLDAGWPAVAFASVRLRRLYPLYVLGTLVGLGLHLAVCRWDDPAGIAQVLALMLVSGLLLMPLFTADGNQVFPLNGPSWSLAIEALLNAGFALFAHRWSARRLALVIAMSALVVAAAAASGIPPLLGGRSATLWVDLARGAFGFGAGMLMERLRGRGGFARLRGVSTPAILAAVCALLLVPRSAQDAWFDPLAILVLCPALVAAALSSAASPGMSRRCERAGAISYPLYILHAPILHVTALATLRGVPVISPAIDMTVAGLGCLVLAWAVSRWVEPALQRAAGRLVGGAEPRAVRSLAPEAVQAAP